jgi:hypothetical protein
VPETDDFNDFNFILHPVENPIWLKNDFADVFVVLFGNNAAWLGNRIPWQPDNIARLTFIFPWQADRIPRQKIRTARLADFAQAIGEAGERREKKFDERVGSARLAAVTSTGRPKLMGVQRFYTRRSLASTNFFQKMVRGCISTSPHRCGEKNYLPRNSFSFGSMAAAQML